MIESDRADQNQDLYQCAPLSDLLSERLLREQIDLSMCRKAQATSQSPSLTSSTVLGATLVALTLPAGAKPAILPKLDYQLMALAEAQRVGVPYALVDAVIKVESDYQADQVGSVGEIGLMQVRPETAAMLGFSGDATQLSSPEVNIHYGALYLARAWQLAKGDLCRTLMKYRAGHGSEIISPLSGTYCQRVRSYLANFGSPLPDMPSLTFPDQVSAAGPVIAPTASPMARAKPISLRSLHGRAFWSVFQKRIGRINAHIEARWRRYAAR